MRTERRASHRGENSNNLRKCGTDRTCGSWITPHDENGHDVFGTFFVPTSLSGGLSFLGIKAESGALIASVTITSGQRGLGQSPSADISVGGQYDFVAMDDF